MQNKKNCWEVLKCGREEGGDKSDELGICPASQLSIYDGLNKGKNAGRFCWVVAGTFCDGSVSGSHAQKLIDCLDCEFLQQVSQEQERYFILNPPKNK